MIDFETRLDFTGKHVMVYSQIVNPCQYSISILKGFALRADDIIKYFANLIKRSIPLRFKDSLKFPYSPPERASESMYGPMCILFNMILMTLHDRMEKNEFGYTFAKTKLLRELCRRWKTKQQMGK